VIDFKFKNKKRINDMEDKRAINMRENKERLLLALEKHMGIVTPACKEAGLSRERYYTYYKNDPDFKKAVDELNEHQIDFVETQLLKNIKNGDRASIIFYMKYKGRDRGYKESVDINANVTFEQPLLKPLDDDEDNKN
jgi:hypothetical protein